MAVVSARLGRAPALVVGASRDDKELLESEGGLRLLLDRGDAQLQKLAVEKGWLVQPAFAAPVSTAPARSPGPMAP